MGWRSGVELEVGRVSWREVLFQHDGDVDGEGLVSTLDRLDRQTPLKCGNNGRCTWRRE